MSRDSAKRLITEYGESVGIPTMALDENDYLALSNDERVGINIYYVEDTDVFLIATTIAELENEYRFDIYEELLTSNFLWEATGGATLSVTPELTHAMMQQVIEVSDLTVEQFSYMLQRHVAMTLAWVTRVQEIMDGDDAPESEFSEVETTQPGQLV